MNDKPLRSFVTFLFLAAVTPLAWGQEKSPSPAPFDVVIKGGMEMLKPWVSFGSDEASQAPEGVFVKSNPHPRAYGTFARLLGKYVREEKVISLAEAIRRLTSLPAGNLGLPERGLLQEGMFADVVVFDPAKVADRATFEKPHQYAVGMKHVFVNGAHVLKDGEHTGAKPGRALWGPGKVR